METTSSNFVLASFENFILCIFPDVDWFALNFYIIKKVVDLLLFIVLCPFRSPPTVNRKKIIKIN